MKGQALVNFIVECSFTEPDPLLHLKKEVHPMFGGNFCNFNGHFMWTDPRRLTYFGYGVILTSPKGFKVQQVIHFWSKVTNNEDGY